MHWSLWTLLVQRINRTQINICSSVIGLIHTFMLQIGIVFSLNKHCQYIPMVLVTFPFFSYTHVLCIFQRIRIGTCVWYSMFCFSYTLHMYIFSNSTKIAPQKIYPLTKKEWIRMKHGQLITKYRTKFNTIKKKT